jgi:hypothetical protein
MIPSADEFFLNCAIIRVGRGSTERYELEVFEGGIQWLVKIKPGKKNVRNPRWISRKSARPKSRRKRPEQSFRRTLDYQQPKHPGTEWCLGFLSAKTRRQGSLKIEA